MNNTLQNQYTPDEVSPPGATLREVLAERGMSQAELAERTGRPTKTINEIINGKSALTPETAIQLERVLGIPASFWNNREKNYRDWLARQEERKVLAEHIHWLKQFPLRSMIKMKWIEEFADPINQLEEILRYFGVAYPDQWDNILQGTQCRQSSAYKVDHYAVSAWLRQGEIQAAQIKCDQYDETCFRISLKEIRKLTSEPPESSIDQTKQLCAKSGVAVVFVPEISGTHTYGATRWLSPSKAMIMLSLRYKTDDHLWFTFFHEAAHLLLHGKREVFLEDDDNVSDEAQSKEEEADRFASDFLIPPEDYKQFHPSGTHISYNDIIEFANLLSIAPGIVVGRLQHDNIISQQYFNKLKRRLRLVRVEEAKLGQ